MGNVRSVLSFGKGITNVPSDAICDDNALEECMGMVFMDGEHRVVQEPVEVLTGLASGKTLLYVHKLNNTDYHIIRDTNAIKWGTKSQQGTYVPAQSSGSDIVLMTANGEVKVTSIGQTLIITDNDGMHYFRWDGSGYKSIAYPIPDIQFEAKLYGPVLGLFSINTGNPEGIINTKTPASGASGEDLEFGIVGGKQKDYNNLVIGLYSENKKEVAQDKGFFEPFFVRAALEMYDGTYTHITNPILLYPSVTENTRFFVYGETTPLISGYTIDPKKIVAVTQYFRLYIKQSRADFSDYSDLIKDVVIFASKGVSLYNTSKDQTITNQYNNNVIGDHISSLEGVTTGTLLASLYGSTGHTPDDISGLLKSPVSIRGLERREQKAINDDIESTSIFHKIASIGLKPTAGFEDIGSKTTSEVIENLTTQSRLEHDDYYSRSSLVPKITYTYNSRLNLANVSRGFFAGFSYFMPFDHPDEDSNIYVYTFDVTVKTDTGNVRVRQIETESKQKQGIYFYYPDSRANHVKIYKNIWGEAAKLILDADLKEHPSLNGAYYFAGFSPTTDEPTGTSADIQGYTKPAPEILYNKVIQSEVSNPFVFLASGYHAVGTGEIIGISTITEALSEGQFGTYPLIVFSKNGIWAMSVDGTGLYHGMDPMSREICNSGKSITQTDGAVFFSSAKGLMVVDGSKIKYVSEQLSGKMAAGGASGTVAFAELVKGAIIAYDYRDSLLWIFDGRGNGSRYCWIYSIKSGTFSRYDFGEGNIVTNVVNSYPDYLLQIGGKVYSLLNRPDINHDGETVGDSFVSNTYDATIVTRPLKFENALALKSIRQIRNVHYMEGRLRYRLFASNDLKRWIELKSLRGMSWKYYKMQFDYTGLRATDRFAGTVVVTQERRTNKLR